MRDNHCVHCGKPVGILNGNVGKYGPLHGECETAFHGSRQPPTDESPVGPEPSPPNLQKRKGSPSSDIHQARPMSSTSDASISSWILLAAFGLAIVNFGMRFYVSMPLGESFAMGLATQALTTPLIVVLLFQIGKRFRNTKSRYNIFITISVMLLVTNLTAFLRDPYRVHQQAAQDFVAVMNADLPQMINDELRADRVTLGEDGFHFFLTFVDMSAEDIEAYYGVDWSGIFYKVQFRPLFCESADLAYYRENGGAAHYRLADMNETPVSEFSLSAEDCELLDVAFASKRLTEPLKLPPRLGGLERGELTNNEADNDGLGVTVRYISTGAKASLYIYDNGIDQIPAGPDAPLIHQELDGALRDVTTMERRGLYESVSTTSQKYYSGSPGRGFEFLCLDLNIVEKAATLYSKACVTGHDNHFVKIRISSPMEGYPLREFVDEVAAILR